MRGFLTALSAVFIGTIGPASAMGLTGVLGDSLSDPCNLWNLDPSLVPDPPYPDKQFTNGNTWATQLGSGCGVNLNYAYGGATAKNNTSNLFVGLDPTLGSVSSEPPQIPDLEEQAGMYIADAPDVDYTAIWIGANDLFFALEANQSNPLLLPFALESAVNTVLDTVKGVVEDIYSLAPPDKQFVLFGIPELGKTPLITGLGIPLVPAIMNTYTNRLNNGLAELVNDLRPEIPIEFFDINSFYIDIINNPLQNGFINVTDPCYDPTTMTTCALPNEYLFWDLVHPTQRVHEIILSEYQDLTANSLPVPLPAGLPLLIGAIGGLALVAKRRGRANN
ncbi:MAG: SGNH/GDSL hydrolase family protein [Pseudomonadota bacterium]